MERSWLIQRLERPLRAPADSRLGALMKDNPFSFGGGLKNGGLSDEAMDLIRDIFAFDYMGAAEYEWGAVPEALRMIAARADRGEMASSLLTVPLSEVPTPWRSSKEREAKGAEAEGDVTIYILAPSQHMDEVRERVGGWARDAGPRLRDPTQLIYSLRPADEWDERRVGWMELDNGFMFFTDEDTWRKTCALFGVEA